MSDSPWWEAGGFFPVLLRSFFLIRFLFDFLEALEGPLAPIGSILGLSGDHLGFILVTFVGYGGSLKTYVLLQ